MHADRQVELADTFWDDFWMCPKDEMSALEPVGKLQVWAAAAYKMSCLPMPGDVTMHCEANDACPE